MHQIASEAPDDGPKIQMALDCVVRLEQRHHPEVCRYITDLCGSLGCTDEEVLVRLIDSGESPDDISSVCANAEFSSSPDIDRNFHETIVPTLDGWRRKASPPGMR
jgi:hypothetical protein